MSGGIEIGVPMSEEERAKYDKLEAQRAAAARARAAMVAKRKASMERTAEERTAIPRTAEDAAYVGVGASPEAAGRAEPPREVSLPETHMPSRRSRSDRQVGAFDIPAHRKKRGWDYQYITIRILGEPVDGSVTRDFRDNGGWVPCLSKDWPELAEPGAKDTDPIETGGQRLMERPLSLTLEAKQEDLSYAQQQQRDRMVAAASGQSARRDEEGMVSRRGVRTVPIEISLEGLAG